MIQKFTTNDELMKDIYNLEEQIQKAQNEPSKKNNKVLSVISNNLK